MTVGPEVDRIHERAKRGVKLLVVRQIAILILTFAAGIALARLLEPAQFGLYAIATFLVEIFALFGNFGLAASFIQRREEPTDDDLRVGFTLQQIVVGAIVVLVIVIAPWLVGIFPNAPDGTVWFVRALAFTLFLTSWRSMSALQLERRLQYGRLAWVEVVETLSFQGTAVALAAAGHGVWSLVTAALVRGVLGTVLLYFAAPWPLRLKLDRRVTREILSFGVPFQLQGLANQASNWLTPLMVGTLIGPQAVGYLTWASSNARKPLLLVDNAMRVAFPHFSRIQDDRDEVERVLVRYLTYLLLPAAAWFALLAIAGPSLVVSIYSSKWEPATLPLILFALALLIDVVQWVVGVTLNSVGQVKATTWILLSKSLLNIGLAVPLVIFVGYKGIPVAYLGAAAVVTPALMARLGRGVAERLLRQLLWILAPLAASTLAIPLRALPLSDGPRSIVLTVAVLGAYLIAAWIAKPQWLTRSGEGRPWLWLVGRVRAERA